MILSFLFLVLGASAGSVEPFQTLLSKIQNTNWDAETCVQTNQDFTLEIQKIKKLEKSDLDWLVVQGESLVRDTFYTRVKLRKQLQSLYNSGTLKEPCALSFKVLFRHLRGVEDYVGHLVELDKSTKLITSTPEAFLPGTTFLSDASQSHLEIKSGDIFISRGNVATSAAIARLGDIDTQFSHLGFVYIDDEGKAWTIEAHIEIGVVVAPLSDWFKDGKSRTAIYRYNGDTTFMHKSAELIFKKVKARMKTGDNLHYDFAMDMIDHTNVFCAEVPQDGKDMCGCAPEGFQLPYFPSRFETKNRYFLDLLGIKATKAFLPADMEIDPQFEFLGEWRSFERINKIWKKDAILTKMFDWIENDYYKYKFSLVHQIKSRLALFLSKNFGMMKEKFPYYMPRKTMMTTFVLDPFVEKLEQVIKAKEESVIRNGGMPFTYFEILGELEKYKLTQEENHKKITKNFKKSKKPWAQR